MFVHPVRNEGCRQRRQFTPRRGTGSGSERIEVHEKSDLRSDRAWRAPSIGEQVNVLLDGRSEPKAANSVNGPRQREVIVQHE
jgi:hypothetical protein